MSDATTDNGLHGERRRALASFAAAFVLHAALVAALALGLGIGGAAAVTPPVTIDLQISSEPGTDALAGSAGPGGAPSAPAASDTPAVAAAPAVPSAPAATSPRAVARAPAAGKGSDSGGFVIPTPRAQAADSTTAGAAGPAFRQAGGKTGADQGIPSIPSPVPAPSAPAVQQGRGSGSASSSGAGVSSEQRSGKGVLVTGSSGSASGGSLDLSKLDKAIAGGSTGKAVGKGGSSTGGSNSGRVGTSGGTGGSSGTGGGAAGGGGQAYNVVWGGAGSGKGRTLVSSVPPKIPSWVSAQGFTLSVVVGFTVLSDGIISGAAIQQTSGYADVDAAVIDAIRRCRFSPAEGAPPARGSISYVIRVR